MRILTLSVALSFFLTAHGQILNDLKNAATDALSDGKLSSEDISAGLKEALLKGVTNGADQAAATDGFFKNPEIKIPFPRNARKVAKALNKMGMQSEVNKFVKALNRSAEKAAGEVKPIFVNAVKDMTIEDAVSILNGKDDQAATKYLQRTTTAALTEKISPIVRESLDATSAAKLYTALIKRYNKLPFVKKESADLAGYATAKTINGLFHLIGKEEKKIRENPAERTTDLLKKVFGS